jgi:hypothetical protein
MGPGMFVIAILGCADGSTQCQQVATLPTRYESRATCAAATGNALMRATSYDFSEIQAECRAVAAPDPRRKAARFATRARLLAGFPNN